MAKAIDPTTAIASRKFSWIPDIPDIRDYPYDMISTVPSPDRFMFAPGPGLSYDLRPQCSPVDDQGRIGSCVLNAETAFMEFMANLSFAKYTELSRLFPYYNCREYQGDVLSDNGTSLRLGLQMLAQYGTCPEAMWPYTGINLTKKPTPECYSAALAHKVIRYYRLSNVDMSQMLDTLKQGYPFVCGITLYSGWNQVSVTGALNLPDLAHGETRLGGHGVMVVGNIAPIERCIVRNSYGSAWGNQGYFTIPYSYLTNPGLCGDLWTIRRN
jgi:C1A family cysteine protease